MTVARTFPFTTKAHSAAIACQCSSRSPPGFNRMETPAILVATGNCLTVDSYAEPPSPTQPSLLSKSCLKSSMGLCCSPAFGTALAWGTPTDAAASPAVVRVAKPSSLTTSETTLVSVKSHVFHVQFSIFLSRSVCGKVRRNSGNWRGLLTKAYCSLATDVPVGELAALSWVPCVVLWIDTGIPSCKSSAGFCTTRSREPSPLRISVLVPKSRPNVTDLIPILLEGSTTTTRDPFASIRIALSGINRAAVGLGSENLAWAYMPANRRLSGFGTSISKRSVREVGSNAPASLAIFPANVSLGYSSTVIAAGVPGLTLLISACGTCTNTRTGSDCARSKGGGTLVTLPEVTKDPTSMNRAVIVPANAARICSKAFISCALLSDAAAASRVAFWTCSVASTVSSSCWELTWFWKSCCERTELV